MANRGGLLHIIKVSNRCMGLPDHRPTRNFRPLLPAPAASVGSPADTVTGKGPPDTTVTST